MIEFGIDYVYKTICEDMGWKETSGYARQRQMAAIKEAFEYYRPINPNTGKERRGVYVFTNQLKEVELVDGRKNNGKERALPVEEFNCLFRHMVCSCMQDGDEYNEDGKREVFVFTSQIYRLFGCDIYKALSKVKCGKGGRFVKSVLGGIAVGAAKSQTISHIAKTQPGNGKGLRKTTVKAAEDGAGYVRADELLELHDEYLEGIHEDFFIDDPKEAQDKGLYLPFERLVEKRFEEEGLMKVKLANVIAVDEADCVWPKRSEVLRCQEHFREVVLESVGKSVMKRVERGRCYRPDLDDGQLKQLADFFGAFREAAMKPDEGQWAASYDNWDEVW